MKKTMAILSALVALFACTKEVTVEEEFTPNESQVIKVDLNFSRSDINTDTKASVKTTWVKGDVIYLFFYRVSAPKYLELTYDGKNWVPEQKNDFAAGDLNKPSDKMTAVYLPYGSDDYTVSATGYSWFKLRKDGEFYHGIFYCQQRMDYTFVDNTLSTAGTINLEAFAPTAIDGDVLVHFDIKGEEGHEYVLHSDFVKPLSLIGVANNAEVPDHDGSILSVGAMGGAIPGFYDDSKGAGNEFVSFSGVLDHSAVGSSQDYRFLIHDKSTGKAYFRVVSGKTISKNNYIGLGDITSKPTPWTVYPSPYFSVAPTRIVEIASSNLVLTVDEIGEGGVPGTATWSFAVNPYDYVANTGANASISGNGVFTGAGQMDLFGWVGTSSTVLTGDLSKYGVSNSTASLGMDGGDGTVYGNQLSDALKSDWGTTIGSGWRTPTGGPNGEWHYLTFDRPKSNEKCYMATVCGKKGIIILPDYFVLPAGVSPIVPMNKAASYLGSGSYTNNVYDADTWTLMKNYGAIFLPAAGSRTGSTASAGSTGTYQSSTPKEVDGESFQDYYSLDPTDPKLKDNAQDHAYYFRFESASINPGTNAGRRKIGRAVRLIKNIN